MASTDSNKWCDRTDNFDFTLTYYRMFEYRYIGRFLQPSIINLYNNFSTLTLIERDTIKQCNSATLTPYGIHNDKQPNNGKSELVCHNPSSTQVCDRPEAQGKV